MSSLVGFFRAIGRSSAGQPSSSHSSMASYNASISSFVPFSAAADAVGLGGGHFAFLDEEAKFLGGVVGLPLIVPI